VPTFWVAVAAVYAMASVVAFVAYAVDKNAARTGACRRPERMLHALALVGGWPGALMAQAPLSDIPRFASLPGTGSPLWRSGPAARNTSARTAGIHSVLRIPSRIRRGHRRDTPAHLARRKAPRTMMT